jgi:hypothetical protein
MTTSAVLRRLLWSLGVPVERTPRDVRGAIALYRSLLAGRRMLLVLDDVAAVPDVRPLLPTGPGTVVIVTSRSRVGAPVRALGVAPFTTREALELIGQVIGADRVARAPDAACDLAARCDFLPGRLSAAAAALADDPAAVLGGYPASAVARSGTSRFTGTCWAP